MLYRKISYIESALVRMFYVNKRISMEGQFFSQFGEDKWIVDNLHYPLSGVFVDVGASDGIFW